MDVVILFISKQQGDRDYVRYVTETGFLTDMIENAFVVPYFIGYAACRFWNAPEQLSAGEYVIREHNHVD